MKIKYLYRREDQSIRHVETVSDWEFGFFRDCNGESNGISLPLDVILNEALCDDEDDYDEDNNQTTENVLVVIRALIRNINIYSIF